jgi:hypothetical protein
MASPAGADASGGIIWPVRSRLTPFRRELCYHDRMLDRARLEQELADAELEREAATKLSGVKRAAGRRQRTKAALKEWDQAERPKRRPCRSD